MKIIYTGQGLDWKQIAREKIFPFLEERLSAMCKAHAHLLKLCIPIYKRAQRVIGFESSITFVIYVGIGCGAGWATSFNNLLAILFGLENIAECGWNQPQTLSGLIAHEVRMLSMAFYVLNMVRLMVPVPSGNYIVKGLPNDVNT